MDNRIENIIFLYEIIKLSFNLPSYPYNMQILGVVLVLVVTIHYEQRKKYNLRYNGVFILTNSMV